LTRTIKIKDEKHVPIMHGVDFIDRMDALVNEFPILTQDDVKEFWGEFRYSVYETYRNSYNWIAFYNIITDIIEEYDK